MSSPRSCSSCSYNVLLRVTGSAWHSLCVCLTLVGNTCPNVVPSPLTLQAIDSIHQVGVYCLALVPANTLPKTPLGGIHLSETKQLFLEGSLHPCNVLMCPHTCVTNLPKPRQKQPGTCHGQAGGAGSEGPREPGADQVLCCRRCSALLPWCAHSRATHCPPECVMRGLLPQHSVQGAWPVGNVGKEPPAPGWES